MNQCYQRTSKATVLVCLLCSHYDTFTCAVTSVNATLYLSKWLGRFQGCLLYAYIKMEVLTHTTT